MMTIDLITFRVHVNEYISRVSVLCMQCAIIFTMSVRPSIYLAVLSVFRKTEALRKSSKTKNKLYKKWLISKSLVDETNYKNYRKIFRKVAAEAENTYYKSMFDHKTNSIKKLWKNLNTVCSLNKSKMNSRLMQ